MVKKIAIVFATGLGAGFSPVGPGTCGTIVAIPLFLALSHFDLWLYIVTIAGLIAIGTWAAKITGDQYGEIDCQKIVIDEIAGYLITMTATNPTIWTVLAGFVLFRFFDILKPFPVGYADKNVKNAFGVMLDDILAGLYALACMKIIFLLIIK